MPRPLSFFVVPRKTIEHLTAANPIPREWLANYLESRPGILDDGHCDVFQPNCRSEKQAWKDFNLFDNRLTMTGERYELAMRDVSRGLVMVFPPWLELFEAAGCRENIGICIEWMKSVHSGPIVISWNHDRDASTVPELQNLPDNFFVLQYNTSNATKNDVLVPFWTIITTPPGEGIEPSYLAGFVGYGGTDLRRNLYTMFRDEPGVYWSEDRVPETEYLMRMRTFKFALCPRGGGLGSYRTYEAIQCGRPPIIISDQPNECLPFWNEIDWSDFAIGYPEVSFQILKELQGQESRWREMTKACEAVRPKFSLLGVQQEIHKRITEWLK